LSTLAENRDILAELNAMDAEALLLWAWNTSGCRAGIFTSFQNTGCALIDMAQRVAPQLRVITLDTLRLPKETYVVMEEFEERYGLQIERFQPDPERLGRMLEHHGEYLFFDSKFKQELCCQVRKVEPNLRALASVDIWISGLRRDQSSARHDVRKASFTEQAGRHILKLNPLADWNEERVWAYIENHNVPCNALYDQGYTSIGCIICTTPTKPWEQKRAGRWRWQNQLGDGQHKECGIHTSGSGI